MLVAGITVGLTAYGMERAIGGIVYLRILLMDHFWRTRQQLTEHTNVSSCLHGPCLGAFGVYAGFAVGCVLVTAVLLVTFGPAAAGSGVSMVMAYLNGIHVPKLLSFKTLMVKIVGTILTVHSPRDPKSTLPAWVFCNGWFADLRFRVAQVASGLPLGPEGPLVHIGVRIAIGTTAPCSQQITAKSNSDDVTGFEK